MKIYKKILQIIILIMISGVINVYLGIKINSTLDALLGLVSILCSYKLGSLSDEFYFSVNNIKS